MLKTIKQLLTYSLSGLIPKRPAEGCVLPVIQGVGQIMLLFWSQRSVTSGLVLVNYRWLHSDHSRPPRAPAASVSADSVPYQQVLHPETQHPPTGKPAATAPHRNGQDRDRWVLAIHLTHISAGGKAAETGWMTVRCCGDTHGTKGCWGDEDEDDDDDERERSNSGATLGLY